jgi:sulfite oxidase
VSLDGGPTWARAAVDDPPSPWAWQLWHTTLDLPAGPADHRPGVGDGLLPAAARRAVTGRGRCPGTSWPSARHGRHRPR